MIGAIAGDIIGSVFERNQIKNTEFPLFSPESRFTDDTVLTVAVARAIVEGLPYHDTIKDFARRYPHAGYGQTFYYWARSDENQPYNSWGNGSAMRVSPVGFAYNTADEVLKEAKRSAEISHNHPEGIKGAQAVALCVFRARSGSSKKDIQEEVNSRFGYDLRRSLAEIRPSYSFDVSCQGSVPESITAFIESTSVEDSIRKAISLGGDSDTMAAIAGGISEAYYGSLPEMITQEIRNRLPDEFTSIVESFYEKFVDWPAAL